MSLCEQREEKADDRDGSAVAQKKAEAMDMICRSLDELERSAKQDISRECRQDNFNPLGLDLLSACKETGEATVLRLRAHWC